MTQQAFSSDTELRKLKPAELYTLGKILDISDSWKQLMGTIPKDGQNDIPKFNSEHFTLIEQAAQRYKRNAAEIFLEEWGTMGRNRPTLQTLLDLLVKAELFRAADYVAGDLLQKELPPRPIRGPAAVVDISEAALEQLLQEHTFNNHESVECLTLHSATELNDSIQALFDTDMNSSFNRNEQSTKLVPESNKLYELYKNVNSDNDKQNSAEEEAQTESEISDLMKFSTEKESNFQNIPIIVRNHNAKDNEAPKQEGRIYTECESSVLASCIYEKKNLAVSKLPALLNNLGLNTNVVQIRPQEELNSTNLPSFLNETVEFSSESSADQVDSYTICDDMQDHNVQEPNIYMRGQTSKELPLLIAQLNFGISNIKKESKENINQQTSHDTLKGLPVILQQFN